MPMTSIVMTMHHCRHSMATPRATTAVGDEAGARPDNLRQCPPMRIRHYETRDQPHVDEICKDVYGGTDMLPLVLAAQAREASTRVFACVDDSDVLHALACCQPRGGVVWVWGMRTRPERRGQGLATQLMERVEAYARALSDVQALLSTTIQANSGMLRIFERQGYTRQAQIDIWPSYETARTLSAHRESSAEGGTASALSLLPGLAALVGGVDAAALLPRWRRCASLADLQRILVRLRARRTGCGTYAAHASALLGGAAHGAFTWLPGDYALWPLDCAHLRDLLQRGSVWTLDAAQGGRAARGVLHFDTGQHGAFAGVVADSPAVVEAAVAKACGEVAPCHRFFIDRCEAFEHEELFALGGRHDYVVVHKVLGARRARAA